MVAALVLLGIGFFVYQRLDPAVTETAGYRADAVPVSRGTLVQTVDASGQIEAARDVTLTFQTAGQVKEVYVTSGDDVEEGDVVAELDNRQQRLAVMAAEQALERARIEGESALIQERQYDLEMARAHLERTKVRAPFSGVAAALRVAPGETVSSGTPLMQLLDDSSFYARVGVDELDVADISIDQRVSIRVDALRRKIFAGTVVEIDRVAAVSGGVVTVPARIAIDEPDEGVLRPGYSVSVRIEVDRVDGAFVVPLEAVVQTADTALASVIRDGEEIITEVSLGISDGTNVAVMDGLEEEDEILPFNYQLFQRVVGSQRATWDLGLPAGIPGLGR